MVSLSNPSRNAVFLRISLTFLLIIASIYALGLSLYSSSERIVERYVLDTVKSQVVFQMDKLQSSFDRIRSVQESLSNNDDVQRYASLLSILSISEVYETVLDIERHLISLRSASDYVADARIYFPAHRMDVSAASALTHTEGQKWRKFVEESDSKEVIQFIDDTPYLVFRYPEFTTDDDPIFVSVIEISKAEIQSTLEDLASPMNGYVHLAGVGKDWAVSASGADFPQPIADEIKRGISGGKISDVYKQTADGNDLIVAYSYSPNLNSYVMWYARRIEVFSYIPAIRVIFVAFSLLSMLAIPVFSLMVLRTVHYPLLDLVKHFKEMENGNLGVQVSYHGKDEFRYLSDAFNSMSDKLEQLFKQVYSQGVLLKEAELKELHSQINPHFLYNSLYVIYRIIKSGDQDLAARLTQKLSSYYQFITRESTHTVTLGQELAHARIYIEIQSIRFDGGIAVDIPAEPPPEYAGKQCPCLMLQPVIENCYKHGLKDKTIGGWISINFREFGDVYQIAVEDNGDLLDEEAIARMNNCILKKPQVGGDTEATGLRNIHRRIQLMYGEEYGLRFERGTLGGLRVCIHLSKESAGA